MKRLQSSLFAAALALGLALLGWGNVLNAQSQDQKTPLPSDPPTADQPQSQTDKTQGQTPDNSQQPPDNSQQPPDNSQQQTPPASQQQPPDNSTQSQQSADSHSFTGTIVKSGDKWMFQDAASGNMYDIDHQDEVKKFEGKKVKVHGTLDPDGKTIHLQ